MVVVLLLPVKMLKLEYMIKIQKLDLPYVNPLTGAPKGIIIEYSLLNTLIKTLLQLEVGIVLFIYGIYVLRK